MKITQDFITKYSGVRNGNKLKELKGLVVHWIGVPQPNASVIRRNFNSDEYGTHYIIDYNTGEIIHCVPNNEVTYHVGAIAYEPIKRVICGANNPNYYLIGIECCISKSDVIQSDYAVNGKYPDLGKPSEVQYNALVEFCAWFLKENRLTVDNLYRHNDITGKACHIWFVNNEGEWYKFKKLVEMEMNEVEKTYNCTVEVPEWGRPTIQKLLDKGYLKGNEKGELGITESMLKLLVINDRAGLY